MLFADFITFSRWAVSWATRWSSIWRQDQVREQCINLRGTKEKKNSFCFRGKCLQLVQTNIAFLVLNFHLQRTGKKKSKNKVSHASTRNKRANDQLYKKIFFPVHFIPAIVTPSVQRWSFVLIFDVIWFVSPKSFTWCTDKTLTMWTLFPVGCGK